MDGGRSSLPIIRHYSDLLKIRTDFSRSGEIGTRLIPDETIAGNSAFFAGRNPRDTSKRKHRSTGRRRKRERALHVFFDGGGPNKSGTDRDGYTIRSGERGREGGLFVGSFHRYFRQLFNLRPFRAPPPSSSWTNDFTLELVPVRVVVARFGLNLERE